MKRIDNLQVFPRIRALDLSLQTFRD